MFQSLRILVCKCALFSSCGMQPDQDWSREFWRQCNQTFEKTCYGFHICHSCKFNVGSLLTFLNQSKYSCFYNAHYCSLENDSVFLANLFMVIYQSLYQCSIWEFFFLKDNLSFPSIYFHCNRNNLNNFWTDSLCLVNDEFIQFIEFFFRTRT